MTELFGIPLFIGSDLLELIIRFSLNFVFLFIIVRFLYFSIYKRRDYMFTYLLISSVTFLLCYMLGGVKIQIGFALGLFAVFGIIRYRTDQMPIKEMTYLFIVIGLAVVNALINKKTSYAELLFVNIVIVLIAYVLERQVFLRHESHKIIRYDNIDLIKPERYNDLKADLEERTGLKINRIEIGDVNFLTDSARIQIYYYERDNKVNNLAEAPRYNNNLD